MSLPQAVFPWIEPLSSRGPKLRRPQAKVLASWSTGMGLTRAGGIPLLGAA